MDSFESSFQGGRREAFYDCVGWLRDEVISVTSSLKIYNYFLTNNIKVNKTDYNQYDTAIRSIFITNIITSKIDKLK